MERGHSSHCRVCGEPASAAARFCPRCGARVRRPAVASPDPNERDAPEQPTEEDPPVNSIA